MCNESEKYKEIYIISFYCSLISAVSCILTLIIICKALELKNPSVQILLFMSSIDLIRSVIFFFPYSWSSNYYFCTLFAIIVNWAIFSNSIWSLFIVYTLYKMHKSKEDPEYSLKFWCFLAFIVAPIYQIIPVFTHSYGFNAGLCGFTNDFYGYIWRGIEQGLIILENFIVIFIYIWMYCRLRVHKIIEFKVLFFEKGLIYTVIYFLIVGELIVFRYFEIFKDFCEIFWLAYISFALVSLHGFFNFLAMFFNRNFRIAIKSYFSKNNEKCTLDSIILQIIEN